MTVHAPTAWQAAVIGHGPSTSAIHVAWVLWQELLIDRDTRAGAVDLAAKLPEQTIHRGLRELEAAGLVTVVKWGDGDRYTLTFPDEARPA